MHPRLAFALRRCAATTTSSSFSSAAAPAPVPLHVTVMAPPAAAAAAAAPPSSPSPGGRDDHPPPPLLFVHGLLGSATNFRAVQTRAARCGRATLAVDLREHGASPHSARGAAPGTLLDHARDVAAALEAQLGRGRAVDVVGHSLGGKVAMVLALTRPALVRRAVIVDIAPVAYGGGGGGGGGGDDGAASSAWRDVAGVVRAAHALDASQFRSRQAVEARLGESVADAGVRAFVCQNLLAQPDGTYRWRHNGAALLASLPHFASFPDAGALRAEREAAAAAAVPGGAAAGASSAPEGATVHFVSGERSGYVRERHHARIRELFPAAVIEPPIAGAGHWVHADKPAEFWRALARILELREG